MSKNKYRPNNYNNNNLNSEVKSNGSVEAPKENEGNKENVEFRQSLFQKETTGTQAVNREAPQGKGRDEGQALSNIDRPVEKIKSAVEINKVISKYNSEISQDSSTDDHIIKQLNSNPDWNYILNAYMQNPKNPDFAKYGYALVSFRKLSNNSIEFKWNGKKFVYDFE
jgi:hypothetical protein